MLIGSLLVYPLTVKAETLDPVLETATPTQLHSEIEPSPPLLPLGKGGMKEESQSLGKEGIKEESQSLGKEGIKEESQLNSANATHNQTVEESPAPLWSNLQSVSTASPPTNPLPVLPEVEGKQEEPTKFLEAQNLPNADSGDNAPDAIVVKKFKFEFEDEKAEEQRVFTEKQLQEVVRKFLEEELHKKLPSPTDPIQLTFAQILQIRSAIIQHYINAGYISSGAYIPEQRFSEIEGIVRIRIKEGQPLIAENIKVKVELPQDAKTPLILNEQCLKNQLVRQLSGTEPLNQQRILDALQLLLKYEPRIERINATLQPTRNPSSGSNENQLIVEVTEKTAFQGVYEIQLGTDNNQSPSIGEIRRQLQFNANNLVKPQDIWSIAYTNSDGSNALDADIIFPLRESNGCSSETLNIRAGTKWSDVVQRPFNRLDIESKAHFLNVSLRQSTHPTPGEERTWSFTGSWQKSNTSLLDIPFPLASGANDLGVLEVFALRVEREWKQRTNQEIWTRRLELSLGRNVAVEDNYLLLRGQAQWARLLAPDTLLFAGINAQVAESTLPALEQLGLGGQDSVRGYRNNFLLYDNGLRASVELQLPILRIPDIRSTVKVIPFMDFGLGWNTGDSSEILQQDTNALWSAGLGLQWQIGDRFVARLDWGIPLVSVRNEGDSLQDQGLYFSVRWTPFRSR